MVELRKRPAREEAPPAIKKTAPKKAKKDEAPAPAPIPAPSKVAAPTSATPPAAKKGAAPKVGEIIDLNDFGGEIETNEGVKTTLAKLVEESKAGVVLFTYPKASTPGCTTQACLFRDSYAPLTATGLSIYGLSTDSPKANTSFKTNKNLPYPLLCDPRATLIHAIGLKKTPSGTTRGIFVVEKSGKVLAAEPGSPAGTVEVVKGLVAKMGGDSKDPGIKKAGARAKAESGKADADKLAAETAAEVADTAAIVDKSKTSTPLPA